MAASYGSSERKTGGAANLNESAANLNDSKSERKERDMTTIYIQYKVRIDDDVDAERYIFELDLPKEYIEDSIQADINKVCSRCNGDMRIKDYQDNEHKTMPCPDCEGEG